MLTLVIDAGVESDLHLLPIGGALNRLRLELGAVNIQQRHPLRRPNLCTLIHPERT